MTVDHLGCQSWALINPIDVSDRGGLAAIKAVQREPGQDPPTNLPTRRQTRGCHVLDEPPLSCSYSKPQAHLVVTSFRVLPWYHDVSFTRSGTHNPSTTSSTVFWETGRFSSSSRHRERRMGPSALLIRTIRRNPW
jgi:hypothetical protein